MKYLVQLSAGFIATGVLLLAPAQAPARNDAALETRAVPVAGRRYTEVGVAGLARMLERKTFTLINVHVPYEGEIQGTDLFIPFDQVAAHLDKLPADRSAQIVVYCRSGRMSAIAARTLTGLGYTDVWNVEGGMLAWQRAGYPLTERR